MDIVHDIGVALAVSESGIIGINRPDGTTEIPWSVPEDMIWFRGLCLRANVIVGKRTLDECLPFLKFWYPEAVYVYTRNFDPDWAKALGGIGIGMISPERLRHHPEDEKFVVVGGAETYRTFLPRAEWASLTTIPDSAVTPLGELESYVYAKDIVETIEAEFDLKKVLTKQTKNCTIRYGKRKS